MKKNEENNANKTRLRGIMGDAGLLAIRDGTRFVSSKRVVRNLYKGEFQNYSYE